MAEPVNVEYFYRVRWGFHDEWLDLFRRNHWPLLREAKRAGHILEVSLFTPRFHGDGRADWDVMVRITYRDWAAMEGHTPEEARSDVFSPTRRPTAGRAAPLRAARGALGRAARRASPARVSPVRLDPAAARRIAVDASLLSKDAQPPANGDGILSVVRHFGSLQLDPTRTVERTHFLVLWSRLGAYDRGEIDRVLWRQRRLLEHNAFLVPIERLPELRYEAGPWIDRWDGVKGWLETNRAFHDSILDQLRERGPLQSRDIDDSKVVEGWRSTGWTHGKNTTRMLEFMAKALEVLVAGRQGQERLWDLAERVDPARCADRHARRRGLRRAPA